MNNCNSIKDQISEALYDKLINANLPVKKLFLMSNFEIEKCLKISQNDVELLLKAASSYIRDKMISVAEMSDCARLSTGCSNIDKILLGGLPAQGIIEIFGYSGSGKTQFCLNMCLMVQLPDFHAGFSKKALYINSDNKFPSERLHTLSEYAKKRFRIDTYFENGVFVENCFEFGEIRRCLESKLPRLLEKTPIGLIIIDSIAAIFRSDSLDADLVDRSQDFHLIFSILSNLTKKYGIVVICVNQVTENPDKGTTRPCLGLSWANLIAHRMEISRINPENVTREFTVINSYELPQASTKFIITTDGIQELPSLNL